MPAPHPTTTPQIKTMCHGFVINVVELTPIASSSSAMAMVRRTPNLSKKAAANGPINPYSNKLTETAIEIVALDQPNSCSSGTIRIPGVDLIPAVMNRVRKVTPAIIQA